MPIYMKIEGSDGLIITNPEWITLQSVTQKLPGLGTGLGATDGHGEIEVTNPVDDSSFSQLVRNLLNKAYKVFIDFFEPGKKIPYSSIVIEDPQFSDYGQKKADGRGKPMEYILFRFTKMKPSPKATAPPANPKHAINSAQWSN